jgi:molybdopterin-containing oxidoreductase family membrane subunit
LICTLIIIGGLSTMYTIIIGGQAYPLEIFPGYEVSSTFFDGVFNDYTPSVYEIALGIGGVAVSLAIVTFVIKVLPFLPSSLADNK